MTRRVLDIGNCGADQAAIRQLIENNFDASVDHAERAADALPMLGCAQYAIVLVNRKLDSDDSDGIEVIREIKSRPEFKELPVMMLTNFPEHQAAAIAAGAQEGFGKNSLSSPTTVELLRPYLQ